MSFITVCCPHCQSEQIVKRGKTRRGPQRYLCQNTACTTGSFLLDYRNRGGSVIQVMLRSRSYDITEVLQNQLLRVE